MSGDYSRLTHDALQRYSALLLQQGRVLLDGDFNELVAILDERLEKLARDALGDPGFSVATPDAFVVSVVPAPQPDVALAPGRLYVDGRLVEIFPDETITYLTQPFLPDPPPLPGGPVALVLEVWEEELTWVRAPLLDPALGGVDTTTRLRTVFQLRAQTVGAALCGLEVGAPPSAGRLTTREVSPPAPDDPCILPPISGYRGRENRLYRVEIHEGGPLGTARFKWSMDNGSIVSPVHGLTVGIGETVLAVGRIGRDPVLRFSPGDWVTITDDHREWLDEPGEIALVTGVDDTVPSITVEGELPAGGGRPFATDAAGHQERHTRIQKWDQSTLTEGFENGLITTAAGPIMLPDGIELGFATDPIDGVFRRGDYWVFWARTATASIEELTQAPPRGIHRHYVQLAAAEGLDGPDPVVINCRPPDPETTTGDSCCTIVVRPGDSLQAAIDALPPEGGCICVKAGAHAVPATLQLNRANVHLHGESPGAILQGTAPLLEIGASARGIRIEMLEFVARIAVGLSSTTPILAAGGARDLAISDCSFATSRGTSGGIAIQLVRTDRPRITDNIITDTAVGVMIALATASPVISGNMIVIGFHTERAPAATGIWITDTASPCHITNNTVLGAHQGIVVNDQPIGTPRSRAASSLVAGNAILTGQIAGDDDLRSIAIDVAAEFATIDGNRIAVFAPGGIGIRATGSGSTLSGNKVSGITPDRPHALGLQLGEDAADIDPVADIVASGNQLAGWLSGVLVTAARGVTVTATTIDVADNVPVLGILALQAPELRLFDNRISGAHVGIDVNRGVETRIERNDIRGGAFGIIAVSESRPLVQGNRVGGCSVFGIYAIECNGSTGFIGNELSGIGYATAESFALGALTINGEWHVAGNVVLDTGVAPDGQGQNQIARGIRGDLVREARIESNLVSYADPLSRDPEREDRALWLRGQAEVAIGALRIGFPVLLAGNHFVGNGASALVELAEGADLTDPSMRVRFERVLFNHNYCFHVVGRPDERRATVVLVGRAAVVTANQVNATNGDYFSFNFNGMTGPFANNVMAGGVLGYVPFAPAADGQNNLLFI